MTDGARPAFSSIDAGVTPAPRWRAWLDAQRLPAAHMGTGSVLVVSAHPDDEVLGAGGLIADVVAAGAHVSVLCLSDGAASHPDSPTVTPAELAAIRRAELTTAMAALGVTCIRHRDLPDGELDAHGAAIENAIGDCLRSCGGHDRIVSVWRADRHPDHDAVGRGAAAVAARTGTTIWEYPVWMWHWAVPDDAAVPWSRAHTHRLSPSAMDRKARAVDAFVSQIHDLSPDPADRAVLAPHVLERLLGPTETFFA